MKYCFAMWNPHFVRMKSLRRWVDLISSAQQISSKFCFDFTVRSTISLSIWAAIPSYEHKNPRSLERGFFHLCRKAQHHLTEGQHHFEQRENIISHSFGTNERCCASRKWSCGKPPQTMWCFASTMFCRWQKRCCDFVANTRIRVRYCTLCKCIV